MIAIVLIIFAIAIDTFIFEIVNTFISISLNFANDFILLVHLIHQLLKFQLIF